MYSGWEGTGSGIDELRRQSSFSLSPTSISAWKFLHPVDV